MSTRADFYILKHTDEDSRAIFICRFCQKALLNHHRIHIQTPEHNTAEKLDQLLWSFRPEAFIPHEYVSAHPNSPVTIGIEGMSLPEQKDIYINLSCQLDATAFAFQRIVEVVIQNPEDLQSSRANFKLCKAHGLTVSNHSIN